MVNLLIVDDDSATRRGLTNRICWEALGIGTVKSAVSAENAIEICDSFEPHIILSDIRMGEMNGIELSKHLKSHFEHLQIILISAYSNKEYLKAAIELEAVQYVEKPIDPLAVEVAVQKALKRYKQNKNTAMQTLIASDSNFIKSQIMFAIMDNFQPKYLQAAIESGLIHSKDKDMRAVILHMSETAENNAEFKQHILDTLKNKCKTQIYNNIRHMEFKGCRSIVVLLSGLAKDSDPQLTDFCETILDAQTISCKLFAAVGSSAEDAEHLMDSYNSAMDAMRFLFPRGYGSTAIFGQCSSKDLSEYAELFYEEFSHYVSCHQFKDLSEHLANLWKSIKEYNIVYNSTIKSLFYKMNRFLLKQRGLLTNISMENKQSDYIKGWKDTEKQGTADAFKVYFADKIGSWMEELECPKSNLVSQVIQRIHLEYQNSELNIMLLADSVYLSSAYLSTLFKKNTGLTIGQYISQWRIEQAKRLLCDNNYKSYQVAEMVGYKDANYFTKVFKRQTGITPSEYKGGCAQ